MEVPRVVLRKKGLNEIGLDVLIKNKTTTFLDLSNNNIQVIPPEIGTFFGLTTFKMYGNKVQTLPPELFNCKNLSLVDFGKNALIAFPPNLCRITTLKEISLEWNRISSVPRDISYLTGLVTLDLSANELVDLPDSFGNLQALQTLNLSTNYFQSVPSGIKGLCNLRSLNMSFNNIYDMPEDIFNLLGLLTKVDLSRNKIGKLPQGIGALRKLSVLNVSWNNLQFIPDSIGALGESLKELDISHNRVRALPSTLGQLKSLKMLYAFNNSIESVDPASFEGLTSLIELDLENNLFCGTSPFKDSLLKLKDLQIFRISSNSLNDLPLLPEGIGEVTADNNYIGGDVTSKIGQNPLIRILNLSQNNIFTLPPEISALGKKLQVLDLSHNNLREFPEEMNHLRVLSKLNISFNRFDSLPLCVSQFRSLQTLNCSYNRIQDLPDLAKLEGLQHFFGDGNQFGKVPAALLTLPKLKKLTLSNNKIAAIPYDITRLTCLEVLDLSTNAIQDASHIFKIHSLTDLNLTNNRIAKLPKDLPALLPAIVDLYLGRNMLTEFPWDGEAFPNARQITVNYNDIHCAGGELPKFVNSLKPAFFCEGNPEIDRIRFPLPQGQTFPASQASSATSSLTSPIASLSMTAAPAGAAADAPAVSSPMKASVHALGMTGGFSASSPLGMTSSITSPIASPGSGPAQPGHAREHRVGWAETCGNRPDMQDAICVHQVFAHAPPRCLVGVYDGHSGSATSLFVGQSIAGFVAKGLAGKETPENALRQAYGGLQNQLANELRYPDGSTAVTVLVLENAYVVANSGDSRAVLCRAGTAVNLSNDDKPLNENEYTRIKRLGGFISNGGRVNGEISVARSLGDLGCQPFVLWEPTIERFSAMRTDEFIILGCDGLWDVFSSQEAVNFIKEAPAALADPFVAASMLRDAAYARGSADNISVVVVSLTPKK